MNSNFISTQIGLNKYPLTSLRGILNGYINRKSKNRLSFLQ